MLADKQVKEIVNKVADLDKAILSGKLSLEDYKSKCAERRAYLDCEDIIKTISGEDE